MERITSYHLIKASIYSYFVDCIFLIVDVCIYRVLLFLVCVGKFSWSLEQVLEEVSCLGVTLSGSKGCLMPLY